MTRISDKRINQTAERIMPYLREVVERDRCLSEESIRACILQARRDGINVANVSSRRSLEVISCWAITHW